MRCLGPMHVVAGLAILTVLWALLLMSEWPMHGGLVTGHALGLDGLGWQLAPVSWP